MANLGRWLRPWLAPAGAVLAVVAVVPPAGTAATRYVFAQALQYAVLAVVAPALIVLGAPWRPRRDQPGRDQPGRPRLADRVAAARSHRPGHGRPWAVLVVFGVVALGWRLPVAVNALVRHPVLTLAEAVTLLAAGCALWLELVTSPPLLPRTTRPQRAAIAALPMWAMWASAYIMGFSGSAWFSALAHRAGHGLGTVADQEIAAGLLWAIPAFAFVPVIYVALISWLRDSSDPDAELQAAGPAAGASGRDQPLLRPPRGWRLPSS
ncbi:MAG TPA: cytochrome c oxidase assembly protein [Streptosporangiaceae bacterium]